MAGFGSIMLASYRNNLHLAFAGKIPAQIMALVDNPLEPTKLKSQLTQSLLQTPVGLSADTIITQVREALVLSIDGVFMMYAAALALTLIITLWLEDRPLRSASASVSPSETASSQ